MPWSKNGGYTGTKVAPNKPRPIPPKTTGSCSKQPKQIEIILITTTSR